MQKDWEIPRYKSTEFKKRSNKYCLIIPVINEGDKFHKQLQKVKPYAKLVDIIIADGGSTDNTTDVKVLKANNVTALLVKTGPGKLGAQYRMAYGFGLQKGYEGFLHMDGNGKDGPEAIPDFINKLDRGFDYIQGSRYMSGGQAINTPREREIANKFIFSPILSIAAGKLYLDTSNGFRAYSKKLVLHPKLKLLRNIFTHYEILFYVTARANRLGLKTIQIPVTRSYPTEGKTPTKIVGWRKKFDVLELAIKAAVGHYNPT